MLLKIKTTRKARWLLRWGASAAVVGVLFYYLYETGIRLLDRTALVSVRLYWGWLAAALLLVPLNWYLEVRKWRLFQSASACLSWQAGWRAVLRGVAWSFLTPGRSGEYAARVLSVPRGQLVQGLNASFGAAYSQLMVLVGMGLPALALYSRAGAGAPEDIRSGMLQAGMGLLLLLAGGLLLPRLIRIGQRWLLPFPLLEKIRVKLELLSRLEPDLLLRGLLLSLLRYGVYAVQYAWMLQFAGVALPVDAVFSGVGTIYLIQTGLPLPPALGFLARGEVAVWIWAAWQVAPVRALWASYGLFVLNLALPALVGLCWTGEAQK